MITYAMIQEAAVNAALTFKNELPVEELEAVAAAVDAALNDHLKWKVQGS